MQRTLVVAEQGRFKEAPGDEEMFRRRRES